MCGRASRNDIAQLAYWINILLECSTPIMFVTVGAALSITYVWSVAGSVLGNALPAKSLIVGEFKFKPTVPLRLGRFPPEIVIS